MMKFDFGKVKDPLFFKENVVPAHSAHVAYKSLEEAAEKESSYRQSLNGIWKFSYAKNPKSAIVGFELEEYDCTTWDDIRVPAHIQMEGYDIPQYANVQYPWDGREELIPGEIPEKFNPTASYVKYFEVPECMKGEKIFVSFQGVESGMALWLNGQYVGYSEDSFTPSDFELTPFLKEGRNKLAVQVYKWTAGSWCEDQDFFRFSGIYRSVYLYAVPKVHVQDVKIQTLLDDTYENAVLKIDLQTQGKGTVHITLSEKEETVVSCQKEISDGVAEVEMPVTAPKLWSAEVPYLYQLTITVNDEKGTVSEVIPQKAGFRRFEMKDNMMHINGKRIVFKGVNRHEFSSISGRAVSYEELKKDIITMKQNNINAIRTCHYPDEVAIYDLCDEYGIYMIAENNMETHGSWDPLVRGVDGLNFVVPDDKAEWEPMLLDRVNSCYQRDKNHPAILIWSCGNESYGGEVIYHMAEKFRALDGERLVHYEGVFNDRRFNDSSDMESQMYPSVESIKAFLAEHKEKPFICCEYTHAMGNSCGAMDKYTELTDTEPLYQGGFIWDYIDQSIYKKDRYGKYFQAYGGDFGDRPTDYNFSGNGIAYGGERNASPKMQAVKYNYQNISITIQDGKAEIVNKNLFVNTNAFACTVILLRDGVKVEEYPMETNVAPLSTEIYTLPKMKMQLPGEYVTTVSFRLKEDTAWAKAGHEVAFGQAVSAKVEETKTRKNTPFTVIHGKNNIGVRGENFDVLFSGLAGGMVSYRYGGKELIAQIPKPNFWRAPVDNDCGNNMQGRYSQWKIASMYLTHKFDFNQLSEGEKKCENPSVVEKEDCVEVTFYYALQTTPQAYVEVLYRVHGDGRVQTTLSYDPVAELADMPEFGMMFKFDADYDQVTWYGNGPQETYEDRKQGAKLGVYKNHVTDNMADYLVPQECGNKTEVRYAKVTDLKGRGMIFTGDAMNFSALPYTPHELENAMHPYELPQIHYTVVRVASQQMGIAGDDSWGAKTHSEYLIDVTKKLQFTFTFQGI